MGKREELASSIPAADRARFHQPTQDGEHLRRSLDLIQDHQTRELAQGRFRILQAALIRDRFQIEEGAFLAFRKEPALAWFENRLTIYSRPLWTSIGPRKTRAHLRKHQAEAPEICPEFVERLLREAHPTKLYSDKTYPWRHIFEGYFPPDEGRPYRVIFELDEEGGIWPVSAFRIRDREYRKRR